jgi:hypothetical protein
MHAGFLHVRNCFPTNFVGSYTGNIPVTAPAGKEIERILAIWDHSRKVTSEILRDIGEKDDGFLFGHFGIADAFFWPVLWVCCFRSFRPREIFPPNCSALFSPALQKLPTAES